MFPGGGIGQSHIELVSTLCRNPVQLRVAGLDNPFGHPQPYIGIAVEAARLVPVQVVLEPEKIRFEYRGKRNASVGPERLLADQIVHGLAKLPRDMVIINGGGLAGPDNRKLRIKLAYRKALVIVAGIAGIAADHRVMGNVLKQPVPGVLRQPQHKRRLLGVHPVIEGGVSRLKGKPVGGNQPVLRCHAAGFIFGKIVPRIAVFAFHRPVKGFPVRLRRLGNGEGAFRNGTGHEHGGIPLRLLIGGIQVPALSGLLVQLQNFHPQLAVVIDKLVFGNVRGCR
ncbi:hypothetical protein D3C75_665580 [compost metagenome]